MMTIMKMINGIINLKWGYMKIIYRRLDIVAEYNIKVSIEWQRWTKAHKTLEILEESVLLREDTVAQIDAKLKKFLRKIEFMEFDKKDFLNDYKTWSKNGNFINYLEGHIASIKREYVNKFIKNKFSFDSIVQEKLDEISKENQEATDIDVSFERWTPTQANFDANDNEELGYISYVGFVVDVILKFK